MFKKMGFVVLLICNLKYWFLHNHNDFATETDLSQLREALQSLNGIQIIFNWLTSPSPSTSDCPGRYRGLWSEEGALSLILQLGISSTGVSMAWFSSSKFWQHLDSIPLPNTHTHTQAHALFPMVWSSSVFTSRGKKGVGGKIIIFPFAWIKVLSLKLLAKKSKLFLNDF